MATRRKKTTSKKIAVRIGGTKRRRRMGSVRHIVKYGNAPMHQHHRKTRRKKGGFLGAVSKRNIFGTITSIAGGVALGAYGSHFVLSPMINWVGQNFPMMQPVAKIAKAAGGVFLLFTGKNTFTKAIGAGMLGSEQIVGATSKFIPGLSGIGDPYTTIQIPGGDTRATLAGLLHSNNNNWTPMVAGLNFTNQIAGLGTTVSEPPAAQASAAPAAPMQQMQQPMYGGYQYGEDYIPDYVPNF
jgi:hypothetical protein